MRAVPAQPLEWRKMNVPSNRASPPGAESKYAVFSVVYIDYFGGSTPFRVIARTKCCAYNRLTLVEEFSVRFPGSRTARVESVFPHDEVN
jgi:hypothetical protein